MTLSIIIPVYNVRDYIEATAVSVLSQSFRDFELVLVDDGSNDGCSEICDRLAASDSHVRVIHKKNGGVSSARNTGVAAARGDYIGFVDSDDYIERDMYEVMTSLAKEYKADIVQCRHDRGAGGGEHNGQVILKTGSELVDELLFNSYDGDYTNIISLCTKIYRKELFNGIVFPEGRTYEDEDRVPHILCAAQRVADLDRVLYHYIYRENSIINFGTFRKQKDKYMSLRDRIDYMSGFGERYRSRTVLGCYGFLRLTLLSDYSSTELCADEYIDTFIGYMLKDKKLYKKYVNKYERLNLMLFSLKSKRINRFLLKNGLEPLQNLIRRVKKI